MATAAKSLCGENWRKPAREITDRAARMRSNSPGCRPSGEKICAFCGSKKNIEPHHIDGEEKNNDPRNLTWACRSCNVIAGNAMRAAGLGRLTHQYNPAGGAQTLAQWVTAVLSMKGESDAMPVRDAVKIIRATPGERRSKFAKQIWQRRRRGNMRKNPAELLIFGNGMKNNPDAHKQSAALGRKAGAAKKRGDDAKANKLITFQSKFVTSQPREKQKALVDAFNKAYQRASKTKNAGGGFGNHKPGCKCPFCKRQRGIEKKDAKMPKEMRDVMSRNPGLVDSIHPGDRVTILTPQNQQVTGRAVMRSSSGGWVLNLGGAHGRPGLADDRNIVRVSKRKNPMPNPRGAWIVEAKDDSGSWKKYSAEKTEYDANRVAANVQAVSGRAARVVKNPRDTGSGKFTASDKPTATIKQVAPNYFVLTMGGKEIGSSSKARAARHARAQGYKVVFENPKRATPRKRRTDRVVRRNPSETEEAVRLFESFHGKDPKEIAEKHVSAAMRLDYAALGDLMKLRIKSPLGELYELDFEGEGVKLASSPDGKQLYCIGGRQNIEKCLDADSLQKDFIDLGECVRVEYFARKVHSNYQPITYYHKMGEKTGDRPTLMYDKLRKQIFFIGGAYHIDKDKGISPGIEN